MFYEGPNVQESPSAGGANVVPSQLRLHEFGYHNF